MKVIKRDGTTVDFDRTKIIRAIQKANEAVDPEERISEDEISAISNFVQEKNRPRLLVEDIQDMVERQLMELGKPMVIALNMMDEVRASGNTIHVKQLSELLGIPVVPISASKNEGISELVDQLIATAEQKKVPEHLDFCTGEVHKAIHSIAHIIEDQAAACHCPARFAATKLVEGDEPTQKMLEVTPEQEHII